MVVSTLMPAGRDPGITQLRVSSSAPDVARPNMEVMQTNWTNGLLAALFMFAGGLVLFVFAITSWFRTYAERKTLRNKRRAKKSRDATRP